MDPDLCAPLTAATSVGNSTLLAGLPAATFDLRHPSVELEVQARAESKTLPGPQTTSVTVTLPGRASEPTLGYGGDPRGTKWTASLPVEVRPTAAAATCNATTSPPQTTQLSATAGVATGAKELADAALSVPAAAFQSNNELALQPFGATVSCAGDLTASMPSPPLPLGPAVTFVTGNPADLTHSLRRELDFAIPVNPAAMPAGARMRHVQVLYQGPMAKAPRAISIANPLMSEQPDGTWVLHFESPWFGTYQAAVAKDSGTVAVKRHLTHRAVIGFSMGGGGSASFGVRHHDQFDAIAPMGGPSDWTWLNWFVETYALGGFCPDSMPGCPTTPPNLYPLSETYAHTEDFNHFWYQTGQGNGGTFSRNSYLQIFEDLALMQGDSNGQNADPALPFMATGLQASSPFVSGGGVVVGGTPQNCALTINPISSSSDDTPAMQAQEQLAQMQQQAVQAACVQARCDPKNAWIAPKGYFDAEYNPDGKHQVISFCDGAQNGVSPYVDTFTPLVPPNGPGAIPVNLALAVDLNGNGLRDANEPVLRQGHEPWSDVGTDGLADASEPNFDPITNPDPDQDDYDFQLNPGGTENDHRYQLGEPFQDVGLDGVKNTPQLSNGGYDYGEGDGVFTETSGRLSFFANDPHSILAGLAPAPGGPVDNAALQRLNIWADGGVRDLFNFGAVANHFVGAVAARNGPSGAGVKATAFYNNFENLPGSDPTQPNNYFANKVFWDDVAPAASLRYGYVDATPAQIQAGDGMHVGTANQILYRLETAFYVAANNWPDADRSAIQSVIDAPTSQGGNVETTTTSQLGTACEIAGHCETYFTGPTTHRTGPLGITLPPGYALAANQKRNLRYPVVYVLHGYGQDPRDLEATAAITQNYESDASKSSATRLAKVIAVYVDGRCRMQTLPDSRWPNGPPPACKSDGDCTIGGITGAPGSCVDATNAVCASGATCTCSKIVPECIEGTFYLNSNRTAVGLDGKSHPIARMDDWFEEVIQYIDQNFRTMGPTDVDVIE